MTEETFGAFTRIFEVLDKDQIIALHNELLILLKALKFTEKQIHSEFPELFDK